MNLKSMSVDQLTSLRQQVEAALNFKVIEKRRAIESKLAKLGSFQGGATPRGVARRRLHRNTAIPIMTTRRGQDAE